MEKLIVKNFLNLEDVELEIKKINIVIGRQAEGKSILAKLVYFFYITIYNHSSSTNRHPLILSYSNELSKTRRRSEVNLQDILKDTESK